MKKLALAKAGVFVAMMISSSAAWSRVDPQALPGEKDSYINMLFRETPLIGLTLLEDLERGFGMATYHPWNGSYWPTHKGMLGHRYMDRGFPGSKTWATNYQYYLSRPPGSLVAQGRINELSPSEKYDLLVNDASWSLTRAMWEKGVKVHQSYGRVPGWFGICHGWSAANHMRTPEPVHSITLTGAGGHRITFYPSDVKALLSYLWAESSPATVFIGNRCKTAPVRDEFGRILNTECFDSNPMTWHVSVLNRVGRDGDSLVFDEAGGGEVWNYALDSYYFRYFNPRSMKPTRHFSEAVVPREFFNADPYKAHRAPGTRYVVGVMMQVFHPAATEPRMRATSGMLYKDKTYIYDLELDENMNIIGGEWYTKDRPDFMWTFAYDGVARTSHDARVSSAWNFNSPLPQDWADAGRSAGERGKVLATLVNGLAERAKASVVELPEDELETPVEEGGDDAPGEEPVDPVTTG